MKIDTILKSTPSIERGKKYEVKKKSCVKIESQTKLKLLPCNSLCEDEE